MTTTATRPEIERRLFTVAEYMAMAETGILKQHERLELLAGEIVRMAPIGDPHLFCTDTLTMLLVPQLLGRAVVRVQGSIQLDEFSAPQPDVVLLRPREGYYAASARPEDVHLVIEVADSSLEYDRGRKAAAYAAAGVSEVWIVDLRTGEVESHTDPSEQGYDTVRTVRNNGTIGPLAFPDVVLELREFMPPMD